jgi:hypothetical protein
MPPEIDPDWYPDYASPGGAWTVESNHLILDTTDLYIDAPGPESGVVVVTGVDYSGADLTGADARGKNLTGGDFTGATLDGADLSGAIVAGANFDGVDFSAVLMDEAVRDALAAAGYDVPMLADGVDFSDGAGVVEQDTCVSGGVQVGAGETLAIQGNLSAAGGVIVSAGGRLLSSGDRKLSGPVTLDGAANPGGGELTFLGDVCGSGGATGGGRVRFAGGYSPGHSPAEVTFETDLAFTDTATLTMELFGSGGAAGVDYDKLIVSGDVWLAGELRVEILGDIAEGQTFDLFDWTWTDAATNGTFAAVTPGDAAYEVSLDYATGVLTVDLAPAVVPEPAMMSFLAIGATALLRRRRR